MCHPVIDLHSYRRGGGGAYPAFVDCAWILDFDEGQQIEVRYYCVRGVRVVSCGQRNEMWSRV